MGHGFLPNVVFRQRQPRGVQHAIQTVHAHASARLGAAMVQRMKGGHILGARRGGHQGHGNGRGGLPPFRMKHLSPCPHLLAQGSEHLLDHVGS